MRRAVALVVLWAAAASAGGPPTVVFLSDFGTRDDAVAACKGVMLGVEPSLRVIDLTHEVPPFSIRDGARLLADTADVYPAGTVFVAVIDPGVGSERKAMIARTKRGQTFVLPDNGLLTLVADRQGLVGARAITSPRWVRAGASSSTFHGRDVFAPAAAHAARGDDWTTAGPPIEHPVRIDVRVATIEDGTLHGEVVATDGPFGNLLTNVDAALFAQLGYAVGDRVDVTFGTRHLTVPVAHTFSDVPVGSPLLYVDSRARVGFAINQGDFAATHKIAIPTSLSISKK